jgi:hypothetical protein
MRVVEVGDTGVGIPAAERAQVFERSIARAMPRAPPAAGLGLAIVREAAAPAPGSATVEDGVDGRGTRVRLTFPEPANLAPASSSRRDVSPGLVPAVPSTGAGILRAFATKPNWSAMSSICIHTGLPAPWPARVSMRIITGFGQDCALQFGGELVAVLGTTRSS